jgi:hypothetical protein
VELTEQTPYPFACSPKDYSVRAPFFISTNVINMSLRASGKLHTIFDAQQVTERFRKREFVVELADNPEYPQYVLFQLTGDRCDTLDAFNVDDNVSITFNLRGRAWTSPKGETKYFNSLDVWELMRADTGTAEVRGEENPQPEDDPFSEDVPF